MSKEGLGISKLEILLMLPKLKKRLKKTIDKEGTLSVQQALISFGWFFNRISRAAKKKYREPFGAIAQGFIATGNLIQQQGGEEMNFELGITVPEIMGMLPAVLAEAWDAYSDDKKITVDEGLDLAAVILEQMAASADDDGVVAFFEAQAQALRAVGDLLEEEAPE
jgi:hypothetical protein